MRPISIAVVLFLSACSPAKDVDELHQLDTNLVMPLGAGSLENYDRYYAKAREGWIGLLRLAKNIGSGKAQITTEDRLPDILDGGCGQVNARFDANARFIGAFCNGDA